MRGLLIVASLAVAFALAMPGNTNAVSFTETAKLAASDAEPGDRFGISVSISGPVAIAGASHEQSGGLNAGAAYIFNQDGDGAWNEVKKLTASDAQPGDIFGIDVAVSGDTAIVGARLSDELAQNAGAAYIFQRDAGGTDNWGQVQKLVASDAEAGDLFGISVAIADDTAVVGASAEDSLGPSTGAAYIFQRNHGGVDHWGEVTKLTASDAESGDIFGESVAVDGPTVVVGAAGNDGEGDNAGAAYVFERDAGGADNWGEVAKLTSSDAEAHGQFGGRFGVAVSGSTVVVGANQVDVSGSAAGAAYVFERDGTTSEWVEMRRLVADDAAADDNFGKSVAIDGDVAVVGAHREDSGGSDAGATYVFARNEGGSGNWGQSKKLIATDADPFDFLGYTVSVSEEHIIAGAYLEDAGGDAAGAAYIFGPPGGTPSPTPPAGLPGDATCDGSINSIDAAVILQFSAGLVASLACPDNADVDESGNVNSLDAAIILQFVAGLLNALPP